MLSPFNKNLGVEGPPGDCVTELPPDGVCIKGSSSGSKSGRTLLDGDNGVLA